MGDSQSKCDENGEGTLEMGLVLNDTFRANIEPGLGEDLSDRTCIVALEQPGVKFLHVVQFVSYMSADHFAQQHFREFLELTSATSSQASQDGGELTMTLDWDLDREKAGEKGCCETIIVLFIITYYYLHI